MIIGIVCFTFIGKTEQTYVEGVEMECFINENDYMISVGSDGYFNCSNCSLNMQKEIKDNYVDFGDIAKTTENINNYFESKNGTCD